MGLFLFFIGLQYYHFYIFIVNTANMKPVWVLLVSLAFFSMTAVAQTRTTAYTIKSLDGIPKKISLTDGGPVAGEVLRITCGSSKVSINNYWAPEKVSVLKNCFLEIKYAQRGGSCVGIGYTLLICVDKDKIVMSCLFMDRLTGCGAGEDDSYAIRSNIIENKIGTYKMDIYIHNRKTITDPKLGTSYNKHWVNELEYDKALHIFRNGYLTLSGSFLITSDSSSKAVKEYVDGKFPIISLQGPELEADTYFCIKGNWYEQGQKNYLIKLSSN
jgi:hypothetical protein